MNAALNPIRNEKVFTTYGTLTRDDATVIAEMDYFTANLPICCSAAAPVVSKKILNTLSMGIAAMICFWWEWRKDVLYAESNFYRDGINVGMFLKLRRPSAECSSNRVNVGNRSHINSNMAITSARKTALVVGVQLRSALQHLLNGRNDDQIHISGFSIDVFKAAVKHLPYSLIYKLVLFHGSNDELVKEVSHKTFDAGLGDIVITPKRLSLTEFSLPYFEPGLTMVEKAQSDKLDGLFSFLRPFTLQMWLTMAAISVFTGFVIWMVKHQNRNDFGGLPDRQNVAAF